MAERKSNFMHIPDGKSLAYRVLAYERFYEAVSKRPNLAWFAPMLKLPHGNPSWKAYDYMAEYRRAENEYTDSRSNITFINWCQGIFATVFFAAALYFIYCVTIHAKHLWGNWNPHDMMAIGGWLIVLFASTILFAMAMGGCNNVRQSLTHNLEEYLKREWTTHEFVMFLKNLVRWVGEGNRITVVTAAHVVANLNILDSTALDASDDVPTKIEEFCMKSLEEGAVWIAEVDYAKEKCLPPPKGPSPFINTLDRLQIYSSTAQVFGITPIGAMAWRHIGWQKVTEKYSAESARSVETSSN